MITIEPWILTLVIVCIITSCATGFFLLGSWLSPTARALREEVEHWKGRYRAADRWRAEAEAAIAGDAPIGSQNGLAELASMFLGSGESFSIPGILKTLKENPEMINQIIQLLKAGTVKRNNGKAPTLPDGTRLKPLG